MEITFLEFSHERLNENNSHYPGIIIPTIFSLATVVTSLSLNEIFNNVWVALIITSMLSIVAIIMINKLIKNYSNAVTTMDEIRLKLLILRNEKDNILNNATQEK